MNLKVSEQSEVRDKESPVGHRRSERMACTSLLPEVSGRVSVTGRLIQKMQEVEYCFQFQRNWSGVQRGLRVSGRLSGWVRSARPSAVACERVQLGSARDNVSGSPRVIQLGCQQVGRVMRVIAW